MSSLAGTKLVNARALASDLKHTELGRAKHFDLAEEAAEITDAGCDWAGANPTKALPAAFVVLHHVMARIGEHLARTGENLRELIGNPPKPGKMDAELSE